MVYKRVNGRTSGRSLSLLNFVEYPEWLNTSRQARARTTDYGFPLVGWQPRSQEIFVRFNLRLEAMESVLFDWLLSGSIPHLRNSKENGYRLWVQWFLESLRWKNVSYDWSMVFIATNNQSKGTLVHPNDCRNRCAESFTLQFLEWELMAPRDRFFV